MTTSSEQARFEAVKAVVAAAAEISVPKAIDEEKEKSGVDTLTAVLTVAERAAITTDEATEKAMAATAVSKVARRILAEEKAKLE